MDTETTWGNDVMTDNDERIAKLEAEIIESKALLSSLSNEDESDLLY